MLVAAGVLAACMLLTHIEPPAPGSATATRVPDGAAKERDSRGGFTLVVHDRYLLLIAVSVLLLNLVNTTGDFILAEMVERQGAARRPPTPRRQFIGAFYGDFQTWVSVLTAVVQIVVVAPRVQAAGRRQRAVRVAAARGHGLRRVRGHAGARGRRGGQGRSRTAPTTRCRTRCSRRCSCPTSRDAKYKAKSAIDTVSVRLGDLASTGLVFVGAQLHLGVLGYSAGERRGRPAVDLGRRPPAPAPARAGRRHDGAAARRASVRTEPQPLPVVAGS